jgi:hypothetical protein
VLRDMFTLDQYGPNAELQAARSVPVGGSQLLVAIACRDDVIISSGLGPVCDG